VTADNLRKRCGVARQVSRQALAVGRFGPGTHPVTSTPAAILPYAGAEAYSFFPIGAAPFWIKPEFDDSGWGRDTGPFSGGNGQDRARALYDMAAEAAAVLGGR
jgi:hypothetical protein